MSRRLWWNCITSGCVSNGGREWEREREREREKEKVWVSVSQSLSLSLSHFVCVTRSHCDEDELQSDKRVAWGEKWMKDTSMTNVTLGCFKYKRRKKGIKWTSYRPHGNGGSVMKYHVSSWGGGLGFTESYLKATHSTLVCSFFPFFPFFFLLASQLSNVLFSVSSFALVLPSHKFTRSLLSFSLVTLMVDLKTGHILWDRGGKRLTTHDPVPSSRQEAKGKNKVRSQK